MCSIELLIERAAPRFLSDPLDEVVSNTPTNSSPEVTMSTITFAPHASFQPRSVRLTRRGRLVVFTFGVLLAFALGVWFAAGSTATRDSGVEQVEIVSVAPGETLWDIASDATDGNVGDMVHRIQDMNSLDSSMVYAGQKLRVPTDG
jgi:hypothetical protein